MNREQELTLLSGLLRKMVVEDQTNNKTFIQTLETLLTILEEHLEE